MTRIRVFIAIALAIPSALAMAAEAPDGQKVYRAGSRPSAEVRGENFTGRVRTDPAFQAPAPARSYGASVTFEPGSRTNWHTHPLGQSLIVTAGKGITQEWGREPVLILPGDVVVCPPGVKHWHGAASDTAMTHLAISERGEEAVHWDEKVSDSEYEKAIKRAEGRDR